MSETKLVLVDSLQIFQHLLFIYIVLKHCKKVNGDKVIIIPESLLSQRFVNGGTVSFYQCSCTMMLCMKITKCMDSGGNKHRPGQSWTHTDGCNECFCDEEGVAHCTRMKCL